MGNTLKMGKQAVLNQLLERGWINRKIHKTMNIQGHDCPAPLCMGNDAIRPGL